MRIFIFVILALALSGAAWGQTQPVVRAKVTPESVVVGEAAELTITVLVPTWFTRPPVYPSFELANAMTRLPADSSYPIRERVGNESWSGIVRTYEINPMLGATYRLAGQTINVTFANPGSDPVSVEAEVPEIVLPSPSRTRAATRSVSKPKCPRSYCAVPCLKARSHSTRTSLSLSLEVEGELDELAAGDAIVLTYRAELDGLPAIFLPPLAPDLEFGGVSAYRDMPDVQDGDTASRAEKVTLVFEAGGEFVVPEVGLDYWNTDSSSIQRAIAPGLTVSVAGPPVAGAPTDTTLEAVDWRRRASFAGLAILLAVLVWRVAGPTVDRYTAAAERRRASEQYAFRHLKRSIRARRPREVYERLLEWLERFAPGVDARRFAQRFDSAGLTGEIDALTGALYGGLSVAVDWRRLERGLVAARARGLRERSLAPQDPLRLNP
jgi:hypothetical protein